MKMILAPLALLAFVASADAARLFRTTSDAPFRERETTFATSQTGPGACLIDLDAAKPRHDYLGLGVSFPESSSFLWSRLPESRRREVMELLWTEKGAGLSIGRIHLGASDYSMHLYSYDDVPGDVRLGHFSIADDRRYVLPAIRAAQKVNPDIFFFASPWSPPGWMKTNGTMCGGSLRREFYPTYAQYFARFVDAYAKEGVKVSAVTTQNEPCTEQQRDSPTCLWSAEDEALFVREHLSKAFAAAGKTVQIWAHDHNFDDKGVRRAEALLADDAARAAVSAVAWHPYAGSPTNIIPLHAAYPQLSMYMTEMGPHVDRSRRDLLWWGDLVLGTLDAGCGAFVSWCYLLDEEGQPNITPGFGCAGLLEIDSRTGDLYESAQFRLFRHIGPFVRRGAKILAAPRIGGSEKRKMDGVRHLAFRNPDGSSVVVFVYRGDRYERRQVQLKSGGLYQTVQLLGDSVTTVLLR